MPSRFAGSPERNLEIAKERKAVDLEVRTKSRFKKGGVKYHLALYAFLDTLADSFDGAAWTQTTFARAAQSRLLALVESSTRGVLLSFR